MAPEPPADFVERPKEFDALKKQLLDAKGDAVAITAALRGAGGYGKTALAKALAHDPDIQDAYFDGILLAELGEKPGNLLSILSDLITRLTGERPGLETVNAAASALGEALGDRRILMIVDDAWREQDLRPFLQGDPNATRLVTTRIDSVVPDDAIRQPVDAMQKSEALQLLAQGLPSDEVAVERLKLTKLAERLGEWAQLLKIVNGFLRDRVVRNHEPLPMAILGANARLDAKGFGAFDPRNEDDRTRSVAKTIGVSLDLLDQSERARFGELGIFPEDADIPIGIAGRLWAETGSLDDFDTEDLLSRLRDLSLLLNLDLNQRILRLHDTVRIFLQDQKGMDGLLALHKRLLPALDNIGTSPSTEALTRRYFYLYLPYHLAAAQEREKLDALLLDPAWLKAKLEATGMPSALVSDYAEYGHSEAQKLVVQTLQLTAGICARDARQVLPQLLGRLFGFEAIAATDFLNKARRNLSPPTIITSRPSLTPPGAEIARLEGHLGTVNALCLLPDGRLASGSDDRTIRLWDVTRITETSRFEGHSGSVTALCPLPHGQLASGSSDKTIRLWDVSHGAETARLEGHSGGVTALCLLEDGRLVSGSEDATIRLWEIETGAEMARVETHSGGVTALWLLGDRRLVSKVTYKTIIWNVEKTFTHETIYYGSVEPPIQLPHVALPGSVDVVRWIWSLNSSVRCFLADGRLASVTREATIRLWNLTQIPKSPCLNGHSDAVSALCVLPGGRLASGSSDKTIRLWDPASGAEIGRLEGHVGAIFALCLFPGGGLASSSWDDTIRLWDVDTGAEKAQLNTYWKTAWALCLLPDERLASAGWDNLIRLWNVLTGAQTAQFKGHLKPVTCLCLIPNGRLASGSEDDTIRLWDLASGAETARLEGHSSGVTALCQLSDGWLASSSRDGTIRLWEVSHGAETARLEGHSGGVTTLCLLADGLLASGSADKTIRLWDIANKCEITRLEIDAPVNCLVAQSNNRLVAGDELGRLHWLEIVL